MLYQLSYSHATHHRQNPLSRNTPARIGSVSTDGGAWQRTRRGSNPPAAHKVRGPPVVGVRWNHRASADVRELQGKRPCKAWLCQRRAPIAPRLGTPNHDGHRALHRQGAPAPHTRPRGVRRRTRGRHTRCLSGGGVGSRGSAADAGPLARRFRQHLGPFDRWVEGAGRAHPRGVRGSLGQARAVRDGASQHHGWQVFQPNHRASSATDEILEIDTASQPGRPPASPWRHAGLGWEDYTCSCLRA